MGSVQRGISLRGTCIVLVERHERVDRDVHLFFCPRSPGGSDGSPVESLTANVSVEGFSQVQLNLT